MSEPRHRDRDLLHKALSGGAECLSLQQLEAVASSTSLDPGIMAHLKACPRCQVELSMLKEFEEAKPLPDEGAAAAWVAAQLGKAHPGRPPEPAGSRYAGMAWLRWLTARPITSAALACVLMLAAGILVFRSVRTPEPEIRAGIVQPGEVVRSQTFRLVSPTGDIEQPPQQLRWDTAPGAARYRVTLMEVDHTIVWAGETPDRVISLPAAAQQKIVPAKTLLWQVTAVDASGRPVAASSVERFRFVGSR